MAIHVGVVAFPGSNCERETAQALRRNRLIPVSVDWRSTLNTLQQCQAFVLVGGFSYEDRLRAGVIASLQPMLDQIYQCYHDRQTPILGICNGAQILLERGWVPGGAEGHLVLTYNRPEDSDGQLLPNHFVNEWVWVMPQFGQHSQVFTNQCPQDRPLRLAIAHGQGRFVASQTLLEALKDDALPHWHYVDSQGIPQAHAPVNPNGSVEAFAAISNWSGDILAMMPHPERSSDGDCLFQSLHHTLSNSRSAKSTVSVNLAKLTSGDHFSHFVHHEGERLVSLHIEDNTASSLQLVLAQQGLKAKVRRYRYWQTDQLRLWPQIEATDLLCERHKAQWLDPADLPTTACRFLVCDKDDTQASYQRQHLVKAYGISELKVLITAELYLFTSYEPTVQQQITDWVHSTTIIYQPLIQHCYVF